MNRLVSIGRYRYIITVFAKHGFGILLDQLGIPGYLKMRRSLSDYGNGSGNSKLSAGERLRKAFEALGPAFIKLGQILSTRPDVLPAEILKELQKLQDSVQPFPFEEVEKRINEELKEKLTSIFKEFETTPSAAASISQVHRAVLYNGQEVAVKVQRPGIEKIIDVDITILKDLAHFVDNHTRYGKMYNFGEMVQEFENTIKNELDFTREGENAEVFKKNFARDKKVTVPEIKWVYTTKHILTMEYIHGARVDREAELEKAGINKRQLALGLAETMCRQILQDGFFHADPHPGNLRVLSDGTIVFLDLGMVGKISERRKMLFSRFFVGVSARDSRAVVRALVELDTRAKASSLKYFQKDVDEILDKYLTMRWNELDVADIFREIFTMAFQHNIRIPREFALISKTLATLQGVLEKMDPQLNALELIQPVARKLAFQALSPKKLGNELKQGLLSYLSLLGESPSILLNLLEKMEEGNFAVQFELKDAEHFQKRFERMFNRISFSLVLLAVSIIIAGIIIGSSLNAGAGSEMYLLNVTVLKIGLGIAVAIILALIASIIKSSRP